METEEKGKCQGVTLPGSGDPAATGSGGSSSSVEPSLCLPFPLWWWRSCWDAQPLTQGWLSRAKGHPQTAPPSLPHHLSARKEHRRGFLGVVLELGGSTDQWPTSEAPVRSLWGFSHSGAHALSPNSPGIRHTGSFPDSTHLCTATVWTCLVLL